MSYPQFQAASDYLGAIADEDYVKALPSNSYEDRGGAVLDGPEAGYKVTYTQADAEAVTAEDGRIILMDEHLADSDAMDYDMDRADGEWALSDYVQKGIEVLDNDTGFFMMCEGGKFDKKYIWHNFHSSSQLISIPLIYSPLFRSFQAGTFFRGELCVIRILCKDKAFYKFSDRSCIGLGTISQCISFNI